jgi:hypothetical protein
MTALFPLVEFFNVSEPVWPAGPEVPPVKELACVAATVPAVIELNAVPLMLKALMVWLPRKFDVPL